MNILILLNREPYDNTDVTWNALRLAHKLLETGQSVRLFLMNDAVDMARDACKPLEGYDQDLSQMLKDLIAAGVPVKACGTCMARCGIYKNHPYFEGVENSNMGALADSVVNSERVLTFQSARKAISWGNATARRVKDGHEKGTTDEHGRTGMEIRCDAGWQRRSCN